MSRNLVSMSDDELRKLASGNSAAWKDADQSTRDALHDENLRIYAILDQRNNTSTDFNSETGTYSTSSAKPTQTAPAAPAQAAPVMPAPAPAAEKSYSYDPASDAAYQQAIAALTQASRNVPTYTPSYDAQLQELYKQIVDRPKFQYDINDDMLYRQYAQQYADQGRMAMQDTMGQAAGLTGGYGSSYAQSVGQQQYDAYLQRLNDVVPELYAQAYGQYQDEGDALLQQYQMLGAMADDEYGKYQDAYNRWANERDYAKSLADEAYQRGYNNYWQGVDQQNADRQFAYNQQNADREYQLALDKWLYSVQQDEEAKAAKQSGGGVVPTEEAPTFDYKEQQFYDYYLNLLNNKSKSHAVTYLNNAVRNGTISQDAANRMMALSPDPTQYPVTEENGTEEDNGGADVRTEVKKVGSAQGEAIIWNGRTYRISDDGLSSLLNDINNANLSEAEINRIAGNLKAVGINVG